MTREETVHCLSLMALLWSSYKTPQTIADMDAAVETWLQFFRTVSEAEVTRTIMEIASDGGEYAPQVGQIYARLKANRIPKLTGDEIPFVQLAFTAAKMEEIDPPEATDLKTIRKWWREVYRLGGKEHRGNDEGRHHCRVQTGKEQACTDHDPG